MIIPSVIIELITDYYVSMMLFETKQKLNTELFKLHTLNHLKVLHETTVSNLGKFDYKFCLGVLNYMNENKMLI